METAKSLVLSLRPQQWVKNLFVFAALIFSQELTNLEAFKKTFFAFVIFILASGAVYLFNDLCDLKNDQNHPQKKHRPLASGKLKIINAQLAAIVLATISLTAAYLLSSNFLGIIFIYLLLNIFYSLLLKKIPILDILMVTLGFVLRAIAGAEVINVFISPWLLVCTFFLALFLAIGKRLAEPSKYVLPFYRQAFLNTIFTFSLIATLLSYSLYTLDEKTVVQFQAPFLFLTIPWVTLGLFRFNFLILSQNRKTDPTETILTDLPIILSVLGWILMIITMVYWHKLSVLL